MNLNELTNEQREAHRVAVCKALGLDPSPELGNLDYTWMAQENGMKNLVLYAKRGVTEQLRDINKIDIKSLDQHDGPGYVSFKATAVNGKGRQEIAVGAHEVEGLTGKRLADGIATAQTRALRRVTLQFAGHGILDESEVNVQLVNQTAAAASQASLVGAGVVMPPPQSAPSTAPGRDITLVASTTIGHETGKVAHETTAEEAQREFVEQQKALSDAATAFLEARNVVVPEDPMKAAVAPTATLEEPKQKRQYRRRNQVSIASPGQVSVPPATANDPEQGNVGNVLTEIPALAEPPQPFIQYAPVTTDLGNQPASVVVPQQPNLVQEAVRDILKTAAPVVDKAKQDEYKVRLRKYSNDILPQAGMVPSEGIGGTTMKLRKFAMMQIGSEVAAFTEEQFEELFSFMDSYVAANGAPGLVTYINKSLGVA